MPGPRNHKKKRKSEGKKEKSLHGKARPSLDSEITISAADLKLRSPPLSPLPPFTPHQSFSVREVAESFDFVDKEISLGPASCEALLKLPYIHDPGSGPRVRDTRAFLHSYFAQPVALDDPLCAEFSQEEVLQMLRTILPEETALILWYNKSRTTGRICPACQRLYRLGDALPDPLVDDEQKRCYRKPHPQLEREQEISGLCSPVCFVLASFNYPGAIKSTWGCRAEDLSDHTWALLNAPGEGHGDMGLGMLLKMTRLDDLGLGQLCLPGVRFEEGERRVLVRH